MKARNYRVKINLSPVDFPAINGLGLQQDFTQTEPPIIINNKVQLKISKKLIIGEIYTDIKHDVFTAQSIYEIPVNEIQTREDIYECYKDANLGLREAYDYVQNQLQLPSILFPDIPIETYQIEIDGVLYLLNTLN